MLNHRYQYPIIPVTGQVLTQGHFGDLKSKAGSHSIGIYDTSTWSVATGSGNGKTFFIGYSSEATKDALDRWHFGRTDGKKSEEFRGKDLISFEYSVPKRTQKETWTVGWDGSLTCNDLPYNFECGKTYGLLINLAGSPTWRRWAKNLQHKIYVTTPCCDSSDCTVGCPSNVVDNRTVYRLFSEKINNHNELSLMGIKARYLTSDYTATGSSLNDYTLSICDGGTPTDLSNVQATVTTGVVYRSARNGGTSVYKVDGIASSPSAYTGPSSLALASCGTTCPVGWTLVAGYDMYNVIRPLSGTENFATADQQLGYAVNVAASYAPTASTAIDMTATGIPSLATDNITVTGHKFGTGQAVVYSNGGGTAPTGLTSGTTYYVIRVDANTLKLASSLANAVAGTQVNITAVGVGTAHSLTPVVTANTGLTATAISGTNVINITGHGFTSGEAVTYLHGGGTAITGLATATTYYVTKITANQFKLSTSFTNFQNGTFVSITASSGAGAAHSFTSTNALASTATFLSQNGSIAVVSLKLPSGVTALTSVLSDTVVKSNTMGATCTLAGVGPTSWVAGQGYYKTSRTLCMHITKKDCTGASNLSDIAALVAADPNLSGLTLTTQATTLNSTSLTSGCTETFTVTQASLPLTDGCLSKDPASYPPIPQGFLGENGISGVWETVDTAWATPSIGTGLTGGDAIWNGFQLERAGLEIFAEVTERYLSDCAMQINDFYETEPIRMEVSWVVDQMTGLPAVCNKTSKYPKCRRKQAGLYQRQSGEWLLREYLKAGAYDFTAVTDDNARMREILDQTRRLQIDRKAYYKLYYIQYKSNKGNVTNFNQEAEVWETMIAFKEDDPKAAQFEAQFGSVFSKFDITLQERK